MLKPNNSPRSVVVMGASFNPPTMDDLRLMQAALDGLNAELGVFVPFCRKAVQADMRASGQEALVLPEDLRLHMLRAMADDDPRLTVDDAAYANPDACSHPYTMMQTLQRRYPDATLYYLTDAKKLPGVCRRRTYPQLAAQFGLAVFADAADDAEGLIAGTKRLRESKAALTLLPMPEGMENDISALHQAILAGSVPAGSMHPGAAALLDGYLNAPPPEKITVFRGKYAFLSNFARADVCWMGLTYQSSEAAFQAAKCATNEERLPFTTMQPVTAKRAGKRVKLREDWQTIKGGVMESILRAKFRQNPLLAEKLLATGNAELIEGNTWGDTDWGVDLRTGRGNNRLGKTLMKIREELRQGA